MNDFSIPESFNMLHVHIILRFAFILSLYTLVSEASILPVVVGSLVGIILFIIVAVAIVLVVIFLINK